MVDYVDLQGKPCNMIDGCSAPANEQEAYDLLAKNFERHYNSNKAPFPMFMHAVWFAKYNFTLDGKAIRTAEKRSAFTDYLSEFEFLNHVNLRVKPWVTQSFLTFDFVERTLKCDQSLESCRAVIYCGAGWFSIYPVGNFRKLINFRLDTA